MRGDHDYDDDGNQFILKSFIITLKERERDTRK